MTDDLTKLSDIALLTAFKEAVRADDLCGDATAEMLRRLSRAATLEADLAAMMHNFKVAMKGRNDARVERDALRAQVGPLCDALETLVGGINFSGHPEGVLIVKAGVVKPDFKKMWYAKQALTTAYAALCTADRCPAPAPTVWYRHSEIDCRCGCAADAKPNCAVYEAADGKCCEIVKCDAPQPEAADEPITISLQPDNCIECGLNAALCKFALCDEEGGSWNPGPFCPALVDGVFQRNARFELKRVQP